MTSSLIGLGMAALPPKALRRLLPPVVSGTTVVLIGTSLADSALQYWGGGILCSRFVQIPAGGCQVVNPATGGQSQRLARRTRSPHPCLFGPIDKALSLRPTTAVAVSLPLQARSRPPPTATWRLAPIPAAATAM